MGSQPSAALRYGGGAWGLRPFEVTKNAENEKRSNLREKLQKFHFFHVKNIKNLKSGKK